MKGFVFILIVILGIWIYLFSSFEEMNAIPDSDPHINVHTPPHDYVSNQPAIKKNAPKPTAKTLNSAKFAIDGVETKASFTCQIGVLVSEETSNEINKLFQTLENAANQSESRIYALFGYKSSDAKKRIQVIKQHLKNYPNDKLINRRLLSECSSQAKERVCTSEDIEQALSLLSDNAANWLEASNYYAGINDEAKFAQSLERILQSNTYDETFSTESLELLEFLDTNLSLPFVNISSAVLGNESAMLMALSNTVEKCLRGEPSVEIRELCRQTGKDMALRGKYIISKSLGLEIQTKIAEHYGQQDLVESLQKENEALLQSYTNVDQNISDYVFFDRELFENWMEARKLNGELESIEILNKDVRQRLTNLSENPCEGRVD